MDGGRYSNRGRGDAGRGRGRGGRDRGGGGRGPRGGGGRGGNYQNQYQNQLYGQQREGGGGGGGARGWSSRGGSVGDSGSGGGRGGSVVVVPAGRPEFGESTSRGRGVGSGGGRDVWHRPIIRPRGPAPSGVAGGQDSSQGMVPEARPESGKSGQGIGGPPQRSPEPVADMTRLKISEKPASSESNEKNKVPIKRPDVGTLAVRTVGLLVNHFKVKFDPNRTILHYNVDIKPDESTTRPTNKTIRKSDLRLIKDKVFSDNPRVFLPLMTAYDGEKNIFSAVKLPEEPFTVTLSDGEGDGARTRTYRFSVQKVNELKLSKLNDYLRRNLLSLPRDILQGMDLVMKENPTKHMISCGRGFYDTQGDDLWCGVTVNRGFQQSLKPTSNGLALCLDYSVLPFRKPIPLLDFLNEQRFGLNDIRRRRMDVAKVIKGLKVTVTHRVTRQKYTISGLTDRNTNDIRFDRDGPEGSRNVSLVEYFQEQYNFGIRHPNIPCLDVGKNNRKNYIPMEFCVLAEGQRYPKEILERSHTHAAVRLKNMSLARPHDRKNSISEMVRSPHGPCGEVTRNFGIQVDTNMTIVSGRVIGSPELRLGGSLGPVRVDREKGQWNLVGKQVADGIPVDRWAVIDFTESDPKRQLQEPDIFVEKLQNRCQSLGMPMEPPVVLCKTNMKPFDSVDEIHEVLESVVNEASQKCKDRLQIIVCVMTEKHTGYRYLKWVSETKVGVLTQCCLSANCNKGQDQFFANLGLKINAKLGGTNAELVEPLPHFAIKDHVMFIGADVNHPPAMNDMCPSIAAVVGSLNWPTVTRYAARVSPQKHRDERIAGFGPMCRDLVNAYKLRNKGVKPQKIVVFRDGVSEGQFHMVLNEELTDLKNHLDYQPRITVVVAQKRHQTRLFLQNQKDGGQSGNVPPGTVVDATIIHPFEFDFYLCSHYGGIGTSKPTHYYVLWDENNFNSNELQKIIYNLCFTFARATKPVSLVPPVYYADLVAYRGRLFQEAVMEPQLPGRASSASRSTTVLSSELAGSSSMDEKFYTMHRELEDVMFFV